MSLEANRIILRRITSPSLTLLALSIMAACQHANAGDVSVNDWVRPQIMAKSKAASGVGEAAVLKPNCRRLLLANNFFLSI